MSQVEVERFLGRIITDADFRARTESSLKSICFDGGFDISPEEMSLLSRTDFSQFDQLAATLDDSIRRS